MKHNAFLHMKKGKLNNKSNTNQPTSLFSSQIQIRLLTSCTDHKYPTNAQNSDTVNARRKRVRVTILSAFFCNTPPIIAKKNKKTKKNSLKQYKLGLATDFE